jgi:hypothetical protein
MYLWYRNHKEDMMNYVVVKSTKSVGVAILLVIVMGPIGLFYSTVLGGAIMTFAIPVIGVLYMLSTKENIAISLGSFFLIYGANFLFMYFIMAIPNIIWAVLAVNAYNKRLIENSMSNQTPQETGSYNLKPQKDHAPLIAGGVLVVLILIVILLFNSTRISNHDEKKREGNNLSQVENNSNDNNRNKVSAPDVTTASASTEENPDNTYIETENQNEESVQSGITTTSSEPYIKYNPTEVGVITEEKVNFYKDHTYNNKMKSYFVKGDTVIIDAWTNGFYHIIHEKNGNKTQGWMPASSLETTISGE